MLGPLNRRQVSAVKVLADLSHTPNRGMGRIPETCMRLD